MDTNTVRLEGLSDFTRALRVVDKAYPGEVRQANFDLARGIRDGSRRRASTRLEKRVAKQGLKATRSVREAAVVLGGPRSPEAFGAEFGAKRYRQFRAWRGNRWGGWAGGPGYFLHPTIRQDGASLLDAYFETLNALSDKAFPD